jgi:ribosomal protein S18 acetylase RimI-like enzyme
MSSDPGTRSKRSRRASRPTHTRSFGNGDALVATGFVTRDGEPGAWRIRGMATDPAARGRGAGTAVLDALVRHATAEGARRIWCHARTRARPFYERGGLRVVLDAHDMPESGPHYLMELRPGEAG